MQGSYYWWAALGLILVILELFTMTFVLLFLGGAALLVALLTWLQLLGGIEIQLIVFAALGLLLSLILRRRMTLSMQETQGFVNDQTMTLNCDIAPGSMATVQYQGTSWSAINDSHQLLRSQEIVRIEKIEGVKLFLKPLTEQKTLDRN